MTKPVIRIDQYGWIKHEPGPCPVPPDSMPDVKFRDGVIIDGEQAGSWGKCWEWRGHPYFNIVAYRFSGPRP